MPDSSLDAKLERLFPRGGVVACSAGLLTSMVTPSALTIPLAFSQGGAAFCVIVVAVCITMTVFSARFLCLAATVSSSNSFEAVAQHFYGKWCRNAARVLLFAYNFGSSVVYLRFIGECIAPLMQLEQMPTGLRDGGSTYAMLLVWMLVTPLTFNAQISSMRYKSIASNFLVLWIVGTVVYRFYFPLPYMHQSQKVAQPQTKSADNSMWHLNQFFAAPIVLFSYECQSNLIPVFHELSRPDLSTLVEGLGYTLLCASSFYVSLGLFGASTFGAATNGNILANYDPHRDGLMCISLLACCIAAGVSYVFVLFPCRVAVVGPSGNHSQGSLIKFGCAISIAACLCALFIPNVSSVISVLGALCSSSLSMTLPSLFAMKMHQDGVPGLTRVDRVVATLMLVGGVFVGTVGTALAVVFSAA